MSERIDFSKCHHYNEQPCPGLILGYEGRSSGDFVVCVEGEKPHSINRLDFIRDREYECAECPKNKRS